MAIGEFAAAFDPRTRDESKGSTYDRAMHLTKGVLITGREDATGLLEELYEAGFAVALKVDDHDMCTPRIETPGESVVGREAIQQFLERQTV